MVDRHHPLRDPFHGPPPAHRARFGPREALARRSRHRRGATEFSSVEVEIDADSIDTGTPERDEHLRSAEFLDTGAHPHILFKSRAVKTIDDVDFLVTGDLTIRGTTRRITLYCRHGGRVCDSSGRTCLILSAHTAIDRRDFGLVWNEPLPTGGAVVGDKVEITIEMEATLDATPPAARPVGDVCRASRD